MRFGQPLENLETPEVSAQHALRIDLVRPFSIAGIALHLIDLITMISGDFFVLNPDQRKSLLNTFATLLTADGSVLLDVASMETFHEATEKTEYEFSSAGVLKSAL